MRLILISAVVVIAIMAAILSPRATRHTPPPAPPTSGAPADSAPVGGAMLGLTHIAHPEIGFRRPEFLTEHFAKHGTELNARDEATYLAMAQDLRDRPAGGMVLEAKRRDGVTTRFDRASGAFLAFNSDLTIRTFFRPTDGETYFHRQLEREH